MDQQDQTQTVNIKTLRPSRVRPGRGTPALIVMAGGDLGKVFQFDQEDKTIGRDVEAQIALRDSMVSRRHAQLYRQKAEDGDAIYYVIVDLHSTNGTFVNGERISKAFLQDGDKIQVGNTMLKFTFHDETDHRYQQEIQRRMELDELTGLLSLNSFYERSERRLKQAQRSQSRVAILMMDLDGLKGVNEKHGHLAGSFLIKRVGRIMHERLGPLGEVGRYGGDEFIALVPDLETEAILTHLENLRAAISEHRFAFKNKTVRITLSVGLATFPWDGHSVEELVTAADAALFSAKRQGKDRIVIYAQE
ncbi:MAG TPA: GGDEF domain-containing protein [Nitrospiria bacterium]|jgi:diguanylate cyclase (GGDEF)-like protein|nr:GGDEF domain-containing protein [Nitrospiria bacterium]